MGCRVPASRAGFGSWNPTASGSTRPTSTSRAIDKMVQRPTDRAAASTNPSTPLFSFGYWGSGSATHALVAGIDAAETLRGYAPPLWVDIRISRSVRAVGFRSHAFARLLGSRYVWLPDLGNLSVQKRLPGI